MVTYYLILVCFILVGARGQVMFTPPVPGATPASGQNCVDKLNCVPYGKSACTQYAEWAKQNCPSFCSICQGAPVTTEICIDKLKNCNAYGQNVCSDPKYTSWVGDNCKYFCRQCSAAALALADSLTTTPQPTTVAPEDCLDKLDCKLYGKTSCSGKYEGWARGNCMNYCGFCIGVPTPPPACVDTIPSCSSYGQATCAKSEYEQWAKQYCRKFCSLCVQAPAIPHIY